VKFINYTKKTSNKRNSFEVFEVNLAAASMSNPDGKWITHLLTKV
jgi:hypothetical protein